MLDFPSSTDVGTLVPQLGEGGKAGSEAPEWELVECLEWEEEREKELEAVEQRAAGELGAREELPLFLPTPSFMASADESRTLGTGPSASFPLSFFFYLLSTPNIFLG